MLQFNAEFSPDQRKALADVIQSLRDTLEHSATLNADAATLRGLADQIRSLNSALAPHTGNKALEHFNTEPGDDLNALLPCSPITGRFNPMAPPVEMRKEGELLIGEATLGKIYEGPPGCVHGAWVAAIYDQLLAFAGVLNRTAGPTANLSVDYLKPTPLFKPLRFEAKVDSADERKVFISGQCFCEGTLITKCEGLFIQFRPK